MKFSQWLNETFRSNLLEKLQAARDAKISVLINDNDGVTHRGVIIQILQNKTNPNLLMVKLNGMSYHINIDLSKQTSTENRLM